MLRVLDRPKAQFLVTQSVSILLSGVGAFYFARSYLVPVLFLGLFLGTYLWAKHQEVPCNREKMKRLVRLSGLYFSLVVTLIFSGLVLSMPEQFSIPAHVIPPIALFIGAGGGGAAMVVSLCALDSTGI